MKDKIFKKEIVRGTSCLIPVIFRKSGRSRFDLTNYKMFITVKSEKADNDYEDRQAVIAKEIPIADAEKGEFNIEFAAKETWIDEGVYYMDVMMQNIETNSVSRVLYFELTIVGTPTNRLSQEADGAESIYEPRHIEAVFRGSTPIIIEAPLISKPPRDMVETLDSIPGYLLSCIDDPEEPQRHYVFESYGPQYSATMIINDPYDEFQPHSYAFSEHGFKTVPAGILEGAAIQIKKLEMEFHFKEKLNCRYYIMSTQRGKTYSICGDSDTTQPIYFPENADCGMFNICLYSDKLNVAVYITGNYSLPDVQGDPSNWMLKVELMNYNV